MTFLPAKRNSKLKSKIMATDVKTMKEDLKRKAARVNPEHKEGPVAKAIESQTSKLPSDTFLWASVAAMAASLTLKLLKKDDTALFVGQWAAPFLLFGVYNKLVKQQGHDQTEMVAQA
jgi:hypothetical protein